MKYQKPIPLPPSVDHEQYRGEGHIEEEITITVSLRGCEATFSCSTLSALGFEK